MIDKFSTQDTNAIALGLTWAAELGTGVVSLEADHLEMVASYQRLVTSLDRDHASDFRQAYEELMDLTRRHFVHEEQVMRNIGFDGYAEHKAEHQKALRDAEDFVWSIGTHFRMKERQALTKYLKYWLLNHMEEHDRKIGEFIDRDTDADTSGGAD